MTNKTSVSANSQSQFTSLLQITFGIITFVAGMINTFWGNDTFFGIFLILLSLVYFPFADRLAYRIAGFTIPWFARILLALFIIWATLGVGEIFAKIELMIRDLG
ncbi:MAG: hypothetical protein ABW007_09805 [Chitinophagaceae bacterium]